MMQVFETECARNLCWDAVSSMKHFATLPVEIGRLWQWDGDLYAVGEGRVFRISDVGHVEEIGEFIHPLLRPPYVKD